MAIYEYYSKRSAVKNCAPRKILFCYSLLICMEERDIDRELPVSLAVCPIELAVIFSRHRLDALCSEAVEAAGIF